MRQRLSGRLFEIALLLGGCMLLSGQEAAKASYDQPYRPQFHFSPRDHWTNDPNGLIYFQGEYHLFFQYNPFGDKWGHMSWGHAVSRDLLHWRQLPVALPEQNGVMIFTGSTVIDEHNTTGFCKNGKPCMVAIYTGHTPETKEKPARQTQNLAYSNDRGRTWVKYSGNPVLDLHMADFRDPKVFWSRESRQWLMAVSLPNEHRVRIYGSPDLKQWKTLSDFGPEGATGGQWECPELFELPVEGSNETRWVLKVGLNPGGLQGGSGEQYFLGRFDGKQFTNENADAVALWTDYGKDCYCALTFNNLPDTQRPIMMGWMDNWQYAADLPTSPWRGQMTIPRQLTLRNTSEGLRLFQRPVDVVEKLGRDRLAMERGTLDATNQRLAGASIWKSHTFRVRAQMKLGNAQEIGWRLLADDGTATVVGYDRAKKKLFVDRTHSGVAEFSKDFPTRTEAPLEVSGDELELDMLVDRSSIEVFAQEGRVAMTMLLFPPATANGIRAYATGGKPGPVTMRAERIASTH